jgi:hypothetical protein
MRADARPVRAFAFCVLVLAAGSRAGESSSDVRWKDMCARAADVLRSGGVTADGVAVDVSAAGTVQDAVALFAEATGFVVATDDAAETAIEDMEVGVCTASFARRCRGVQQCRGACAVAT